MAPVLNARFYSSTNQNRFSQSSSSTLRYLLGSSLALSLAFLSYNDALSALAHAEEKPSATQEAEEDLLGGSPMKDLTGE